MQSDGRIWVNGDFTSVNNEPRIGLVRLGVDGSIDPSVDLSAFVPDLQTVSSIGLMSDDRLYVIAGSGFNLNNSSPVYLRLLPDGSVDTGFNPDPSLSGRELFVQGDDRAIVKNYEQGISELRGLEGVFTRLNLDGGIDDGFSGPFGFGEFTVERDVSADQFAEGPVTAIWAVEPEILTQLHDGKLLAMLPGPRPFILLARLNPDGTVDDTFDIGEVFGGQTPEDFPFLEDPVRGGEVVQAPLFQPELAGFTDAVELPDGSLLVSGQFAFYRDHYSPGLVRLFADGSIDFDFSIGDGAQFADEIDLPGRVDSVTVDGGGGIYLTGFFNIFNSAFAPGVVKLLPFGVVDTRFAPGIGLVDFVSDPLRNDLILNPDGSALITGQYRHDGDPWPFALSRLSTAIIHWGLDLSADPPEGGFVEGGGIFADQSAAPIFALPKEGYQFAGWVGAGVEDPSSPATTVLMTEDRFVSAAFAINNSFAARALPDGYVPGEVFTVLIDATPDTAAQVNAVEDRVPDGWTVSNINEGGSFDSLQEKVKFGPFFDNIPRTFSYDITPPSGTFGPFVFEGLGSVDGFDSPIAGDADISTAGTHPADLSPEDFIMKIGEVTAYGAAWKVGAVWPRDPNPIPIDYVTRAGALWKNGEIYRFDPTLPDPPLWWVNSETVGGLGKGAGALVGNTAISSLPLSTVPDLPFTVTVAVSPSTSIAVYAVEDAVPAGWTVGAISDGGSYDAVNKQVKWLFLDNHPRTLSYEAIPPENASGGVSFSGLYSYDGSNDGIAGERSLQAKPAPQTFGEKAVEQLGAAAADPNLGGAAADFSKDGISNLMAYALGLDLTQKNNGKLPSPRTLSDEQGNEFLTLTYTKNKKAVGLDYFIEVSSDLGNWNAPPVAGVGIVGETATAWIVEVRIPVQEAGELFLRLRVQAAGP